MSIPVELPHLQVKTVEYTWAYLLTVRPAGTPHLVSLSPLWSDHGTGPDLLMSVSAGTATNATAGSVVTLCYPPLDHDGYSLIVDGAATVVDPADVPDAIAGIDEIAGIDGLPDGKVLLRFAPTSAVLHRSASPGFANSATGCANDCLPVDAPTQ